MRLTDLTLKSLKFEGKATKIFDDGLPNFGVRVYKSGISFIVMMGNERRMTTLGRYPDMSLKTARQEAVRLLTTSVPKGPITSPDQAISAFLDHVKQRNKPHTIRHYSNMLIRFPNSFERAAIQASLSSTKNTPGTQFHITVAFRVFLNWCVTEGVIQQNPIAGIRNQGRIQKRDRVLTPAELVQIWQQLADSPHDLIVKLMILTGQRKGEIEHLRIIDELGFIPKEHTKNGHAHTFPVPTLALPLIPATRFNGWSRAKARLDRQSEVTNWTYHDLRRTYATVHQQIGTPVQVTEKLLNHTSGSFAGVTGIYQRYSYMDEMKQAVQAYEAWLQSQVLRQCQT